VRCAAAGAALGVLVVLAQTAPIAAQSEVRGRVIDATTGRGISQAFIRVDASGALTFSEPDGAFLLERVPAGPQSLSVQAFGYASDSLTIEVPVDSALVIELDPTPMEVEGVEATVTLEERLARIEARLDDRVERLPGDVTVADAATIRPYDTLQAEDPWIFMIREMKLRPTGNEYAVQIDGFQALESKYAAPEVYLDDRPARLYDVVHAPLSRFCRIEFYSPMPYDITPDAVKVPHQLRVYTCWFMAAVALGNREMSDHVMKGSGPRW
jgi:hypothetical protein